MSVRRLSSDLAASLASLTFLLACGATPDAASASASPKPQPEIALSEAPDRDPAADVVSVKLVAAATPLELLPGHEGLFQTYSGTLPGPLLRAKAGDRLQVEFENHLDEPTTIHWHGVRIPNAMDGVPHETQLVVPPGGTFLYDFVLPDAGAFWYHPHHQSANALGNGLFGALLVSDPAEADLGDEVVLVLSDVGLDANGAPDPAAITNEQKLLGREGSTLLVNGRLHPTLEVTSGRRQRWRVLNAARSRYFRLGLAGHHFSHIGGDGGRNEYAVDVEEPILTPGERLDLLLEPEGAAGTTLELMAQPVSRGLPLAPSSAEPLLTIRFVESTLPPSPALPELTRTIEPFDVARAERVALALTVSPDLDRVEMGINDVPFGAGEPLHAQVGTTQILMIENKSPYSHPFHLHGFYFQELAPDLSPKHPLAHKDTIDIPPLSLVPLAVAYDDRPGMWMFHCHILDHAEAGMMGMIHVMP